MFFSQEDQWVIAEVLLPRLDTLIPATTTTAQAPTPQPTAPAGNNPTNPAPASNHASGTLKISVAALFGALAIFVL